MKAHESEHFVKYGSFFYLLLIGAGVVLPFLIALLTSISGEGIQLSILLSMTLVWAFLIWMFMISMLAYGKLTTVFVKQTAKDIENLPYHFNYSYQSRGGILYIDVEGGMIGFISSYNPKTIQIFNAARIEKAEALTSGATGIRFVFYLDGQKITMPTLLTNRVVSTKSGIGAEAVAAASTYTELLLAAKRQAETLAG